MLSFLEPSSTIVGPHHSSTGNLLCLCPKRGAQWPGRRSRNSSEYFVMPWSWHRSGTTRQRGWRIQTPRCLCLSALKITSRKHQLRIFGSRLQSYSWTNSMVNNQNRCVIRLSTVWNITNDRYINISDIIWRCWRWKGQQGKFWVIVWFPVCFKI